MTRWKREFSSALVAVLVAGCGSKKSEGGTTSFAQTLKGTWVTCSSQWGPTDAREAVVFDGTGFVVRRYDHPTSDLSCGGEGILRDTESGHGSYTVGASVVVPDPEGNGTVTAYQLDGTTASVSSYTIAYVKTSVTPNVLYMGDDSGTNNGTTPALRPTTLQTIPRTRAPEPMAFPASLQGTFESCVSEFTYDVREVLAFSGSSVDTRVYDHATTDGSCGGRGYLRFADSMQGTFTLGADVAATVGVLDVTAVAADVTPALASTFYSIVWVDSLASPRTVYTGDDNANQLLDGTAPEKRPTVLEQWKPRFLLPAPPAFPGILQGSWENCRYELDYSTDVREVFQFSGANLTVLEYHHTTTDGTCGNGAGSLYNSTTFTFTTGAAAPATLPDPSGVNPSLTVTANAFDFGTVFYTIVYVDTSARPYTLYIGDEKATTGLDGTSPATRPTVLQGWKPRFQL